MHPSLCMHACIMPNVLPYRAECGQSDNLSLQFKDDIFYALINSLAAQHNMASCTLLQYMITERLLCLL